MATPYRQAQGQVQGDVLRYLRRDGNRRVRARRRRRTALRLALLGLTGAAVGAALLAAGALGARWATDPGRFQLARVLVRGTHEATEAEIERLAGGWMGQNILGIDLAHVEKKVREHPWIGSSGSVRIQRRLPGSLVITVRERTAGGIGLAEDVAWLLDEQGMPIDRFGPRYARHDFPIIKGLEGMMPGAPGARREEREARPAEALATGVEVTRALAEREPGFSARVSEIDVSEPDMVVLRLEGESYDLRLSREDHLRNLRNYFALRERIKDPEGGEIEYVDLRWHGSIAVMPAAQDGGR